MKNKYFFPLLIVFLLILRIIFSFVVWHPDLNNHADWGVRFFEYGASNVYSPDANVWSYTWPNQPPGTMYMFAGIRKMYEFVFKVFWQVNIKVPAFPSAIISYFETNLYPALLKLPAILSDFGIAYIIYKWTRKKWAGVLWLLNPVVWYNSTIWGQYDSVINLLALLSFYLLSKKKLNVSLLAFALSIYVKASLLIFAPIFLILALRQRYKIGNWMMAVGLSLLVILILTIPFTDKNSLIWLYELYSKKIFVQQLHLITANAFNLWAAVAGIHERPDSLPFLGLTYKLWGYILFAISYVPLLIKVYKKQDLKTVVWVLALAAFSSFVLLTNMHERYLYPLFPYLTVLFAFGEVKVWKYWVISIISLLGMYNFWFMPRIESLVSFLSFGDRLTPRILGFLMFTLFLLLYKRFISFSRKT